VRTVKKSCRAEHTAQDIEPFFMIVDILGIKKKGTGNFQPARRRFCISICLYWTIPVVRI
jgi:hypothetical protein